MPEASKVFGIELWSDGSVTVTRDFGSTISAHSLRVLRNLMNELENCSTTEASPPPAAPTAEQPPK
jgi:hypothetical protein